ncbi:MAG: hypothetical protein AAFW97_07345 [Pseudomonadota bacterium]
MDVVSIYEWDRESLPNLLVEQQCAEKSARMIIQQVRLLERKRHRGSIVEMTKLFEVPFEYTLAEREIIRARFKDRKAALGIGNPSLAHSIYKTVSAKRAQIEFPDETKLPDPTGLTDRDLNNFEKGRMTRHDKLVIIDAYLRIVELTPPNWDDHLAA